MRWLIFTLLLSGCALLTGEKIQEPKVELQDVEIDSASTEGAKLLFALRVNNPNAFKLKVDSVKYSVEIGGKTLSTETINTPTEVAANAESIVRLPLTLKYADIFTSIGEFLRAKGTPYRLKGDARIGILTIPFDESGEIKIEGGELKHKK